MTSHDGITPLRISMLMAIVVVMLLALVSRLWFLQVLAGERYRELSERNRVQIVYTEAPRGRILARDGDPIVKNRPAHTISVDSRRLLDGAGDPRDSTAEAVLRRLSELLEMSREDILARLTDKKYSPFRATPLAIDVTPEIILAVKEHQELFPGVIAETLPVRTYPRGDVAAQVLGWVAEVSEDQLDNPKFASYRLGDMVGKSGVEASYEQFLQGQRGRRLLEVNAKGTVLEVLDERPPEPGTDLRTSLDIELQAQVEEILEEGVLSRRGDTDSQGRTLPATSGAAVVLDVDSGEVLAMASYPSYDPREFVGGVSPEYFNDVYRDVVIETREDGREVAVTDPDVEPKAGTNRVIEEVKPPGSVFKAITAAAFLQSGFITTSSSLPCPPVWDLGRRSFRNWNSYHEGMMDITRALKRSCDTFFYELASRQWTREETALASGEEPPTAMQDMARAFGYDEPLGIDLPEEAGGTIPDRAWKEAYWEEQKDRWCSLAEDPTQDDYQQEIARENCEEFHVWKGGDSVNMSIGQGFIATTPLQVASSFAAIANGGTVMRPHVGLTLTDPDGEVVEEITPRSISHVGLEPQHLAAIRTGLEQVVMDSRGTARGAFRDFPLDEIPVAGKTGSAEENKVDPTTAWFASYAPADDPEIAVVAMVERGGGGSTTAAPIVRRIYEAYFDLPVTEY